MEWYNPMSWFRTPMGNISGEQSLICDNPQCSSPIQGEPVAYNEEHREVYHNGNCATFAIAHRTLKSNEVTVVANLDHISLDRALELLRTGKLSQSPKLEERLS